MGGSEMLDTKSDLYRRASMQVTAREALTVFAGALSMLAVGFVYPQSDVFNGAICALTALTLGMMTRYWMITQASHKGLVAAPIARECDSITQGKKFFQSFNI